MYKKILAAIQSDGGKSFVFEQALEIARLQKASLMFYHCKETEMLSDADSDQRIMSVSQGDESWIGKAFTAKQKEIIEHQQAWLDSLCIKVRKEGIDAQCLVEEGHIGKRIVDISRRWGADLIVLGRTKRGSLVDCLFGTVSDYVIHHAKCSLLLVQ